MRQIFFARALGAAQRGLGILHERVGVVAIVRIARKAAFHIDRDSTAIHGERRAEDFGHLLLHPVHRLVFVARGLHDETESAATEVREQFGRVQMALEAVGDLLQQQVAGMPAEGIVEGREVLDVEHRDRRRTAPADARFERPHQAFAEQAALGEASQRIEVRQEADLVFLVEVLQRERQVRDQLAQHARLLVTDRAHVVRREHHRADRRAIDQQWIAQRRCGNPSP